MAIANACKTVLVPPINARARVVVREVIPSGAIGAVVFTHGPPRTLAKVRPPAFPMLFPLPRLLEPSLFRRWLLHVSVGLAGHSVSLSWLARLFDVHLTEH